MTVPVAPSTNPAIELAIRAVEPSGSGVSSWENGDGSDRGANLDRTLTHPLDSTEGGLAVKATRDQSVQLSLLPTVDTKGRKATTEQIISAYQQTGSVWRAGKLLGMAGQSVHERLVAVGYKLANARWADDEVAELRVLVGHETIGEISRRLGRPYDGVACKISELGIGTRHGNRRATVKVPRGAGYDKAAIRRHIKAIDAAPGTPFTRYARANGLSVEMLARSIEKHFPDWWQAYRRAHSDLPEKACEGCGGTFIPSTGKQTYCTRRCANTARSDRDYFGGKRANTIGLAEGRCQLCAKRPPKGLSSHHFLGKENDPDNAYLIALCMGCHQLVTLLGCRDWEEVHWEALITFAWLRKRGPQIAGGEYPPGGLHVTVDIEWEAADDEDEDATEALL